MKPVVQSIKKEIAALERLAKSVPDDALAQASISGQVNALRWAIGRVAPCLLVLLALIFAGNVAFAQTALAPATQRPNSLAIDSGTKTATAVSGAATLAKGSGVVTSEALTTAAAATYTLTITDTAVSATDLAFASVKLGTATTGLPEIATATPGDGSLVVVVRNAHASAALNGTIAVSFFVLKR